MTTATWNGATIAESDKTVVVEGNHYFPPGSVRKEFLQASSTTSRCPWKGTARYYSLVVDGKTNEDAAWYYPATRCGDPPKRRREVQHDVAAEPGPGGRER
jgi:uncharacterized protein (DUF427 family)